jgi:glycosyltransferase involved in cell wall biosynthesis
MQVDIQEVHGMVARQQRPLNILLLCEGDAETRDSWSGTSKSLVGSLRADGHNVFCGDVDLYGLTRVAGLAATWAPRRFHWWARYHLGRVPFELRSRRAKKHIETFRSRIDLILQIGATFEPRGREGVPYVLYCDGNARLAERGETGGQAEVTALRYDELKRVIEREQEIYREAAAIMTLSEHLRTSFIEDFCIPSGKVIAVGAGPNTNLTPTLPEESGRANVPTILFVGRNFERKGGPLLLKAFAAVQKQVPDAHLLIVGPPALKVDQPGVTCLGFLSMDDPSGRERLQAAYGRAHVFCLPTKYEPFGLVFVEAMLFALPCVGPRAWAVPEIIVHGETGLIVPPDDQTALADALIRLLSNQQYAQELGEAGRRRALERFSWKVVARRIQGVLRQTAPTDAQSRQFSDY